MDHSTIYYKIKIYFFLNEIFLKLNIHLQIPSGNKLIVPWL